jgi:hypothetical protein
VRAIRLQWISAFEFVISSGDRQLLFFNNRSWRTIVKSHNASDRMPMGRCQFERSSMCAHAVVIACSYAHVPVRAKNALPKILQIGRALTGGIIEIHNDGDARWRSQAR